MSLHQAIPQKQTQQIPQTTLKTGVHKAKFLGMSQPYIVSAFADGCPGCGIDYTSADGKAMKSQGPGCNQCNNTGKKQEQKVRLKYEVVKSGAIEEEEVSYRLSAPSSFKNKSGQTINLSPSTLFRRFQAMSTWDDPERQALWFDEWTDKQFDVLVTLVVGPNQKGTYMKIKDVIVESDE